MVPLSSRARWLAHQTIVESWRPMVLNGATSFWETTDGGDDFGYAGSLCHGWSALPVYYRQAWTLGVRPLTPGFERFCISAWPGDLAWAEGAVPTPHGRIRVQ